MQIGKWSRQDRIWREIREVRAKRGLISERLWNHSLRYGIQALELCLAEG